MRMSRPAAALAIGLAANLGTRASAQSPRPSWPAIDSVFQAHNLPRAPGCAVAVASHDTVIYEHGYGRAVIEWDIPIDAGTVFELGSTSKQFTAFSILLLEHEGELALTDDVRKWIPELPRYGKAITLSHLLHHTSGIRDYDPLLVYRGTRYHDVATNADIIEMLSLQRGLNFTTGTRWQYSNSNYVLLAIVVERASKQHLRDFLRRRVFEPLGMTSSRLRDDHTEVIPHRARGYEPATDNYTLSSILSYYAGRYFFVFGAGTSHARHDDIVTDVRRFAGKDIMIVRRDPPPEQDYRPYFREVEFRTFEVAGATLHVVLGRGFDYAAYREGVLKQVRDRWYRIPAMLPVGNCYFCARYFPADACGR